MVVLYCVAVALPFAAMKLKWRDHPIAGVLPPTPYPKLSLDSVRSEQFQTGYTAWFESHLGDKGYSIAVDNTVLYHAFRDTKVGSAVMLGRDRVLFKDEDIAYFNKAGTELPGPTRAGLLADRIARMQARMREQHRAFVPLIIPSKTSILPDKVADRWTRELGMPRPSDVQIYRAMKRELDARKVRYGVLRAPLLVPVVRHRDVEPPELRPSAMFIGTSFQWTIMKDAERTHLFGAIHMDYYNKLLVAWPQDVAVDVHPHTPEWRDLFMTKDLYILDLFEVFLLAPNTYVDEILDQFEAELDASDDSRDPTTGTVITSINDLGVTDGQHYFELWGAFPNPAIPYTATITCDGSRASAAVYYQNPNGQQLNVHANDPGVGRCDHAQKPPRATGVSCTFRVKQGAAIGSPPTDPRRVCPGPQGKTGQEPDGRCTPGLAGC